MNKTKLELRKIELESLISQADFEVDLEVEALLEATDLNQVQVIARNIQQTKELIETQYRPELEEIKIQLAPAKQKKSSRSGQRERIGYPKILRERGKDASSYL